MPVIRSPFATDGPSSTNRGVPASRSTRSAGEDFSSYISRLAGVQIGPTPRPYQEQPEQISFPARLSPPSVVRPPVQRRVQEPEPPQPDKPLDLSGLLSNINRERREERGADIDPKDYVAEADVRDAIVDARTQLAGMFDLPSGQRQQIREQLDIIETGEASTTGGIAGLTKNLFELLPESVKQPIREGASEAWDKAAFGLSTPFRAVQSYAKEVTDPFVEGEQISLAELGKQTIDPDFDPEYKPIQDTAKALFDRDLSSNGWITGVDTALDLGVRIGADPITWFQLAPFKYQSAGGRAAAAQDFLRSVTAVPLDEATKAQYAADIYRYGPNYLPTNVRDSLVREGLFEPAGIRFAGQVIPGTKVAGETLGAGISATRARIGDIGGGTAATAMTPGSLVGLTDIARGANLTTDQILDSFAIHASALQGKADARRLSGDLFGDNDRWLRQADGLSDEENRLVIDFAEGIIDDVPENLREVAEAYRRLTRDEALAAFNAQRADISQRRGLRLEEVTPRENWFHRTFSAGAKSLMRRDTKVGRTAAAIVRRAFKIGRTDLNQVEGFTMARTEMDTFLGKKLIYRGASTNELNDIFMAKYGVPLFENRVSVNARSYVASVVDLFERQAFIDNLFRYRPGAIKPLLSTEPSAQAVRKVIDELESALRGVDKLIVGAGEGTAKAGAKDFMTSLIAGIRNASNPQFLKSSQARSAVKRLRTRLVDLENQIAEVSGQAARATADAQDELLTVVGPLEARIRSLRAAIDAGEGEMALAEDWLRSKYAQVFLDTAGMPSGIAGIADALDKWALNNLSGAALKSNRQAIATRRAQAIRRGREIDVDGTPVKLSAAKEELGKRQREVTAAEATFNRIVASDPDVKHLKSLEQKRNKVAASLDVKSALAGLWDVWEQEVGILYRFDMAKIRAIIDEMPKSSAGTQQSIAWLEKVDTAMRNLESYGLNPAELDTLTRVMSQLFSLESDLSQLSLSAVKARELEDRVRQGLMDGDWVRDLETGWKGIEALQAQMSPELSRAIVGETDSEFIDNALRMLGDPQNRNLFLDLYDANLRYFKSTAILTLGFTVRNAVTAAMNNLINSVTTSQAKDGLKFAWDAWKIGPREALAKIPAAQRGRYERAWEIVSASGGGKMVDEIVPVTGRNKNRFDNQLLNAGYVVGDYVFRPFGGKLSAGARRLNENVEIGVRMPLALNAVDQGYSLEAGVARIRRVQFDYTDLSALDRVAKRIIPFWIFASRNIPMQLVNQAVRPGPYRAYEKLRSAGDPNDDRIPRWRAAQQSIPIGDWFLNLDLPFVNLGEEISLFTSLSGLAGQISPLPRALAEYITGQRIAFGTSYPYSEDYRRIGITDLPGAALGLFDRDSALQQRLVKEKNVQVVGGMLPALQNIQRYIATFANTVGEGEEFQRVVGGPETYYERPALEAGLKAIGIDLYKPREVDRSSERRRIIAEINDLMREQGRIGEALSR